MRRTRIGAVALLALGTTALMGATPSEAKGVASITRESWGSVAAGAVDRYTLSNGNGMRVRVLTYGGIIQSVEVPDRKGHTANVALGFKDIKGYVDNPGPYFGALIGRYGNRIAKGQFTLDGQTYHVPVNNGPNSLHGGTVGFDKHLWRATEVKGDKQVGLRLSMASPDGDQGYPGTLYVTVTYTLTADDSLRLDYRATTTKATVLNLTNHSYWNLQGEGSSDIADHVVQIHASHYTPVDSTLIPTGAIAPVAGTALDFRKPTAVGARIRNDETQLMYAHGYDHNFVLDRTGPELSLAAQVTDPTSGRLLSVYTTEPGMQFYSGNFLDGS
jgi:aldose 1-epimerase